MGMPLLTIFERAFENAHLTAISSTAGNATYGELLDTSASVSAELLDGRDDLREAPIAFLVPADERYVYSLWGIWRAGGIAVPLGISATERELHYALSDSQAVAVIVARELADRVAVISDQLGVRTIGVEVQALSPNPSLPEVRADRRAMILYTSGTTSTPKGVVTTHAGIEAQIKSLVEAWRWEKSDRIPLFLPLHHIHGVINVLSCALWSGAQVEAFPRFDVPTILHRVAERAYTCFMAVPTIYVKLIETLEALPSEDRDPILEGFAEMRLMVSGSAALPASVHRQWRKLTGQPLLERYGMTEIGMAISNPYEGERRPGAVGKALPGVEIQLQCESGSLIQEENVPGEILVRGPTVFKEYWRRPEATEHAFVDGWFRTGDIAVVEDGYYRIIGRSSIDIIKSGGYKLSALEIEACLLDHPAISQCAVVGAPDDRWGEVVAAVIVPASGELLDLDLLRTWCQGRLSPYKIPRKLMVVEGLPRNAMGKVKKSSIAKFFSPAPNTELQ